MILSLYLNAKTKDELIVKQEMMNTLSGKTFRYRDIARDGSGYTCWFDCDKNTWLRVTKIIDERLKPQKKQTKKESK
jgi:hypothetical protein